MSKRKIATLDAVETSTGSWPIKKQDGEPLYRRDVQYDFLAHVFGDSSFRFTPPVYTSETAPLFPTDRSWSFAELYLDALANSTKAAKNLKDKMAESQFFAVAFGKIALLINAGRINTTLAFFSEMKTPLRTYHPIPCMQVDEFTRKNLQDAPRMKTQLKGCLLYDENASQKHSLPETLKEVAQRGAAGKIPPTNVVELIFLLFQEHAWVSEKYFSGEYGLLDLFCPIPVPSHLRSHVFLSILFRYLEQPHLALKVHEEDHVTQETAIAPLQVGDVSLENIDMPEEIEFAQEMLAKRAAFLRSERIDEAQSQGPGAYAEIGATESVVLEPLDESTSASKWNLTAAPDMMDGWTDFCNRPDQTPYGPLDLTWNRIVTDTHKGRDPAEDSDDDTHFEPIELRSRLCGFVFDDKNNNNGKEKSVYRYQPRMRGTTAPSI